MLSALSDTSVQRGPNRLGVPLMIGAVNVTVESHSSSTTHHRLVRDGGTFGQHALIADRLRGQNPLKVVRAVTVEKTVLLRLEVPLFNNYLSALDRARSTELRKLGQVWRNSVQPSSIRHVRRHGGFRGWVGVRPVDIAAQHRCRVGPGDTPWGWP